MSRRRRPFVNLLGWLASLVLRALGASWRIRFEGPNPLELGPGPHLGALWHRGALVTAYLFRDRGFSIPVSTSKDGDLVTALLVHMGYAEPPRGSSTREGSRALRGLVRTIRRGTTAAVLTDGPRGPARQSKVGIFAAARLSDTPITPLAVSARPCLRFSSWDGMLLPLPFARVVCAFAPAMAVDAHARGAAAMTMLQELDTQLDRLTDELDDRLSLPDEKRPHEV
ncbi:MAG: DUF374 domain-containing protein [Deltaproteobacteria bacterium]|nr:DUF374 domain-containing protein [Deltaproteobacteria bacterium]MBW2420474.1 DUF374 domain-containing protein [Deltaproteobacteria bacterium]